MLDLRQAPDGRVSARFRDGAAGPLRLELPPGCRPLERPAPDPSAGGTSGAEAAPRPDSALARGADDALLFDCGPAGLSGARVAVRGLGPGEEVLLLVELPGRSLSAILRPGAAELVVPCGPARAGGAATLRSYLGLGVAHIAAGLDHLLFLLCLLCLVSGARPLLLTVTAFTAAHSLALAGAALQLLRLPQPPVEASIALSIAFLAVELCRPASPLLRRRPYVAAFGFGLVHGIGFAGALGDAGLPEGQLPAALLGFNAGVELGQVAFIAAVLLVARAARRLPLAPGWSSRGRLALGYTVGSVAAFWFWQRVGVVLAGP